MRALPIRPLPIPTEPLADYLERLGCANGYRGTDLWRILDKGICSHPKVLSAALNGHALPKFSGPAIPHVEIEVDLFGLQSADFSHIHRRWCPMCIEDAAWLRPAWRLKVSTICTVHRLHLLQRCPQCHSYPGLPSILHGACECGVHFVGLTEVAIRQEVQLAALLEESLTRPTNLTLGQTVVTMSTPQITRLICYAGRLIEGPSLRRPGKIRELEDVTVASRLVAGTASLLADWPSAFWRCLEGFVEAAPADASVRRVFGSLYHVLYQVLRDSEFQFLRDAFELFLLEHWRGELCGRHRLFNLETIQDHRHQGLARVARAVGLGSQTLRRMVHQDRFPANKFSHTSERQLITIDKNALARLLPNPDDYIDLRSTARVLGMKRSRLRELIAHGAILADAKPNFARSNHWHFRRSEVLDLLSTIRQFSAQIPAEVQTTTLNHALRYWRVSATELGELIRAVKRREIPYTLPERCTLSEMTFGEQNLRAWLARTRESTITWVSVSKAAELLDLKEQVVYQLVSRNLIVADVIATSGHAVRRVKLTSLEHFKETFISAAELAKRLNTSSRNLLKAMEAIPATGPSVDGGRQYFFRRADLNTCFEQPTVSKLLVVVGLTVAPKKGRRPS